MKNKKTVKFITLVMMLSVVSTLVFTGCGGSGTVENDTGSSSQVSENSEPKWKIFLVDYEKWVDDYVDFMKKFKSNPTDLSLVGESEEMYQELAEWETALEELQTELETASPEEIEEYSSEVARIAAKMESIAY